jgi:hypothetical protein
MTWILEGVLLGVMVPALWLGRPRFPKPPTVNVVIHADITRFVASMSAASKAMVAFSAAAAPAAERFASTMRDIGRALEVEVDAMEFDGTFSPDAARWRLDVEGCDHA